MKNRVYHTHICSLCLLVGLLWLLALPHFAAAQEETPEPTPRVLITRAINVREGPSTRFSVIAVAQPGAVYTVTGQSPAGTWLRLDFAGQAGWLYGPLTQRLNVADVPVIRLDAPTPTPIPSPTQEAGESPSTATARMVRSMNIRGGPGTDHPIVGTGSPGQTFRITGSNATRTWWRIDFNGQDAWVFAPLVAATDTGDVRVVPGPAVPSTVAAAPVPSFDPQQTTLRLEPVLAGLEHPVFLTHAGDGSGRLFVVERPGRIRVYDGPNTSGSLFLDITDRVNHTGFEQGLLGLAFPPNYASSGYFFVNYTRDDGDTIIARFQTSGDPNRADPASESVVLWIDEPAPNHNGGMLAFGPDGYLWIGTGDGGGANDTFGNGQNGGSLQGAMLRLDVTSNNVTSNPAVPYRIPPDNPWIGPDDGVRDEIWAIGLRNPWRYSFDRRTGDLWIADVGQSLFEEINRVDFRQGGLNFGWPVMEGMHCSGNRDCETATFVMPIDEYGHDLGCSVTGGYVYRGSQFPVLNGVYLFADFCSGNVWTLWQNEAGQVQRALVLPKAAAISSFGEDEDGELYALDFGNGVIHRIIAE